MARKPLKELSKVKEGKIILKQLGNENTSREVEGKGEVNEELELLQLKSTKKQEALRKTKEKTKVKEGHELLKAQKNDEY